MKIGFTFFKYYVSALTMVILLAIPYGSQAAQGDLMALEEAIQKISIRYDVYFTYNKTLVQDHVVDFDESQDQTLVEAVEQVLAGTSLRYRIHENKYVIIYKRDLEGISSLKKMARHLNDLIVTEEKWEKRKEGSVRKLGSAQILGDIHLEKHRMVLNVSGTVTDQAGEPLIGVNMRVKGTNKGTATDFEGRFSFEDIDENAVLVVSYVGYKTQEVSVAGKSNINITLTSDSQLLDEVVVVGYGTQKKRDLTGSVSSVSSRDIERVPVLGLDQALQGRASGVFVSNNNANPGGEVNIRIRGTNSIQGNNEPLYVIDGFIGGNINTVNPADIESVDVLKDASSTAIYGSRGANGVVIVTTKKGSSGQSHLNLDVMYGLQNRTRKIDLMGARDYADFINKIDEDKGRPLSYPDLNQLEYDTDWQDLIYRTAPWQQYTLSAGGGNEKVNYYVSGSYIDQQGIVKETGYDRFNVRANVDGHISDRVTLGTRLGFSRIERTRQSGEEIGRIDDTGHPVARSLTLQPTAPAFDDKGELLPTIEDPEGNLRALPLFSLRELLQDRFSNNFTGNLFAEFQILKPLKFRTSFGYNIRNLKQNSYKPSTVWGTTTGFRNSAGIGTSFTTGWLNENYFTFQKDFNAHNLQIIGGSTIQGEDSESFNNSVSDFALDDFLYHNLEAGAIINSYTSGSGQWRQASFFGRIQYNFKDKYLFTFNGRYDGSSKFGKQNKWGFFPSGALAWRLSDEKFVQDLGMFSDLKLRASYGISGSDALGPYRSLSAMTAENPAQIIGDTETIGFIPTRLPNPDLRWEQTSQLDIGLDFGILNGRLRFVMDYFAKETRDLFLDKPVPWTSGVNSVQDNIGNLQNNGFEFGVDGSLLTGDLTWKINLNGTFHQSKIEELGDVDEIITGGLGGSLNVDGTQIMRTGEPLGTFYGYQADGVWKSSDNLDAYKQFGQSVQPGDLKIIDVNGDGDVNALDRTIIGFAQPRFFGGLNNYFTFKGLDLSLFFQYVSGNHVFNALSAKSLRNTGSYANKHTDLLEAWTENNQDTEIPRAGYDVPNVLIDNYLENASFMRMREVTVGYSVPLSALQRINISKFRVYVTGVNLMTLTKYTGYDPEVNIAGGSINVINLDNGSYPRAKTVLFGLNITF